ncbi:MAG: EAL domain-containing protein [Eubacterium sp.]|nr:EAL domain-containing protein [Eubacterium sp.]
MAKKRKRIAVILGQADESFQSRFISGLTKQAFDMGKDVCVFSMLKKYQDTADREMGESNIFSLVNPDFFDGIVIMKDTLQTSGIAEEIEENLHKNYEGPVLVVDLESKYFSSIYIDCFTPVMDITNHLIEDHGVRDIAFLTGKKRHRHSLQRQAGFMEAMKNHKLEVPENRIIEGDFWYLSGEQCVDMLVTSGEKLPEAIVCANDPMAIGVCKAFEERGIRVPEDIIVVGCDSNEEGQSSPKIITSYIAPAYEMGMYALEALEDIRTGRSVRKFMGKAELLFGETCGCILMKNYGINSRRSEWNTVIYEEGFDSVNNMIFENLMIHSELLDYVGTVYSYVFQIKGAESFDLCLVDGIQNMNHIHYPKNEGYPAKMIHAIKYCKNHIEDMVSMDILFDTKDMLPGLTDYRDEPKAFFFTPVFFETRCFGYAVVSYGNNHRSYDELYRKWIKSVAYGLENLRKNMAISELMEEVNGIKTSKFDKVEALFDSLSLSEKEDYELVRSILDNNLLKYHFQPIVSAVDGSIFSYEALMRSKTRKGISPLAILKYAGMQDRFSDIESKTFNNVLDIIENKKDQIGDAKVFINSIPGVRVRDIGDIEKKLRANHERIVVELTEEAEMDDADLERLKNFFKNLGLEVAVDDYGTGYSNVSNLLRYMPNYVKIDRSLLSEIQNKPQKQHFVREIIDFCHSNNIKALAEGVETSEELRMVIHLGADLIQGFYTGKPSEDFIGKIDEKIASEIKLYHQERSDGKSRRVYVAGKTNRVSLINLVKEGCTDIVVGQEGMVYKDISIIGMPTMKTDVHLRVESGYSGRITLENVYFSNIKNRPCIEIGDDAEVTVIVEGNNFLKNNGILVPESSSLILEGNSGALNIELGNSEYYGIGNDLSSKHGNISINMFGGGSLNIKSFGNKGVYIGSGLGGKIEINGGDIFLEGKADQLVGIGAFSESSDIVIARCTIEIDMNGTRIVGIGSYSKESNIRVSESTIKCMLNGLEAVGLGTIDGESTNILVSQAFIEFLINADQATSLGAYNGKTDINIYTTSIRIEDTGKKSLVFGGNSEDTTISLVSTDTRIKLYNKLDRETFAKDENFKIVNGRCKIFVNEKEIEREIIFKYS